MPDKELEWEKKKFGTGQRLKGTWVVVSGKTD